MKAIPSLLEASAAVLLVLAPSSCLAQIPEAPTVSVTEQIFSLPILEANRLLMEIPSDARRHARLNELLATGDARLERLVVVRAKSGQHAVAENFNLYLPSSAPNGGKREENRTASEGPTSEEAIQVYVKPPEVRDSLEIEPVVGPDGVEIDLNVVAQSASYARDHTQNGMPRTKQSILDASKITTFVLVRDGQPYFLGTINPPIDSDQAPGPKEQRVWLDFITANMVLPEHAGPILKAGEAAVLKARGLVLPPMSFRDATLSEAVLLLQQKSVELDPKKKGLKIALGTVSALSAPKITLSLDALSLYEALRVLAAHAGLTVETDDSGLILQPAKEMPDVP